MKKFATVSAITAALLVGATGTAAASSLDLTGLSEQTAYDILEERNTPYLVYLKTGEGDDCLVAEQFNPEPVWTLQSISFGSLELRLPVRTAQPIGLILTCE